MAVSTRNYESMGDSSKIITATSPLLRSWEAWWVAGVIMERQVSTKPKATSRRYGSYLSDNILYPHLSFPK